MNYWNHALPQNTAMDESQMRAFLLGQGKGNESGCWEWTGTLSKSGYGKIKWQQKDWRVHRLMAHLWLGMAATDERLVCHACDNPKCFNPAHLFVGTSKDNQQDSVRKGRHWSKRKTHCKRGHSFDPENTYVSKSGQRHCRACHNVRELARYRRRVSQ